MSQVNGEYKIDEKKLPPNHKINFYYKHNSNNDKTIISSTFIFKYSKNTDKFFGLMLSKNITDEVLDYDNKATSLVHQLDSNINMLSHDLKGLVNNIMGYSILLEMNLNQKDKVVEYLNYIRSSTTYINKLIHSILKLSELVF